MLVINFLKVNILEQLSINKDLPADILDKMSKCAVIYGRFSVIRADLETYRDLILDKKNIFMMEAKQEARKKYPGKFTETYYEEKSILGNLKEYKEFNNKIRKVNNNIEKIKRVMTAIEMQAEQARSICSYNKKEWKMSDEEEDSILGKKKIYK